MMVRVVTRPGGVEQLTLRTVRRTVERRAADRRWTEARRVVVTVRAFAFWTIAGRDGGFSATCTALPPMIAPPHAHAQSCAKAIRTDIEHLFLANSGWLPRRAGILRRCFGYVDHMQRIRLSSSALTMIARSGGCSGPLLSNCVPIQDKVVSPVNERRTFS